MIDSTPSLEERLLRGYGCLLELYDRAAEILDKASAGSYQNSWAHSLHVLLLEAAALDAAMAGDVATWRASARTAAGPLKEILERLTLRLRTLSEGIDRQVDEMRTSQMGLSAEIDEFIQKRRMLQAYVKNG